MEQTDKNHQKLRLLFVQGVLVVAGYHEQVRHHRQVREEKLWQKLQLQAKEQNLIGS